MVVKDPFPLTGNLSEKKWNAEMDALETNWLLKLADTQDEYQEEHMRLENRIPPKVVDL
jgi:hypothetical protein